MPNNPTNITNVTPPRVPLTDERTGLISREWYRFFLNLFQLVGQGQNQISLLDVQYGPPQGTANPSDTGNPGIAPDPLPSELLSTTAEMQKQIYGLEMGRQPQFGTMAELQQANVPWLTFATSPQGVPTTVGTVAWDGGSTLGVQATANVIIRVGESEYVYVKASSAITKGQLCYHTGAVGSSGVITAAPTPLALADPNQIVGVAAETIALNDFGLIQISGDLRGFNTTGSSVGETWADGDPLYYNPAYVGSMTKVKPSAPNQKSYIGEVINAGSGGSGSMHIRIVQGSVLGGTDSNVQFGTLANGDLIQYDSALGYWKNVPATTVGVTTFSAGTTGLTPSAPTSGAVTLGGTLATTNGGTGLTSFTANGILYATSTSALTTGTALWFDGSDLRVFTNTPSVTIYETASGNNNRLILSQSAGLSTYNSTYGSGSTNAHVWQIASTEYARLTNTQFSVTGSVRAIAGTNQDAVVLAGRAGGTSGYSATFTPTTLSANRTLTIPDNSGTLLTTGATVTVAQGGTGVTTTPANGQLLIGNGTGYTVANLTAGTGVSISNTAGGISISATGTGGTVTSVSVVSANGFAGTVANATTTPAITISTSITGLLYGNGTAIAAATVSSPLSYSAGTLSIPVATSSANGYLSSTDWSTFNAKQPVAAPVTQTANFSVGATDVWTINNKSGSSCTVTLPTASSNTGRVLYFQNYQAQTLVSASSNVVPIGGGAAGTSILLASAGDQCTLVSNGTNWIIMQYVPNNILLLE